MAVIQPPTLLYLSLYICLQLNDGGHAAAVLDNLPDPSHVPIIAGITNGVMEFCSFIFSSAAESLYIELS